MEARPTVSRCAANNDKILGDIDTGAIGTNLSNQCSHSWQKPASIVLRTLRGDLEDSVPNHRCPGYGQLCVPVRYEEMAWIGSVLGWP